MAGESRPPDPLMPVMPSAEDASLAEKLGASAASTKMDEDDAGALIPLAVAAAAKLTSNGECRSS